MADSSAGDLTSLSMAEDHPRPSEEGDNIDRSKKKHRQDGGSFSGTESRKVREEEWMQHSAMNQESVEPRMSYRDSVRNPVRSLDFNKNRNKAEGDEGKENTEGNEGKTFSDDDEDEENTKVDSSESSSEEEDLGPEEEGNGISIDKDVFDRLNFTLSDREWKRLNRPFRNVRSGDGTLRCKPSPI
ncbi:uncharacterized protein G2W53_026380 [Senna tora]|uniref:Uncharacterized protein n=1 Tax=Senna tora TaxID=362788 RepID=A0A834WF17_9FABA|nr:uncharacterized protein G2W53_026380 [Senna tora]